VVLIHDVMPVVQIIDNMVVEARLTLTIQSIFERRRHGGKNRSPLFEKLGLTSLALKGKLLQTLEESS